MGQEEGGEASLEPQTGHQTQCRMPLQLVVVKDASLDLRSGSEHGHPLPKSLDP